jgi:hypothetical protein
MLEYCVSSEIGCNSCVQFLASANLCSVRICCFRQVSSNEEGQREDVIERWWWGFVALTIILGPGRRSVQQLPDEIRHGCREAPKTLEGSK